MGYPYQRFGVRGWWGAGVGCLYNEGCRSRMEWIGKP